MTYKIVTGRQLQRGSGTAGASSCWQVRFDDGRCLIGALMNLGEPFTYALGIACPLAGFAIIAGFLWLIFDSVRTVRRFHNRRPPGTCFNCGYSLTGNQSGICPECGKPISPQAT